MLTVVQCHPSRTHLRAAFDPSFEFFEDNGIGARRTFVKAVQNRGPLIYLQDDGVCCPGFSPLAKSVADVADVVMLYCNRKPVLAANPPAISLNRTMLTMAVGLCLSKRVCAIIADWELIWAARNPQHKCGIDYCLRDLLRSRRWSLAASVPSLVQHRDTESLLGHPCGNRQSRSYSLAWGPIC